MQISMIFRNSDIDVHVYFNIYIFVLSMIENSCLLDSMVIGK